MSKAASHTIKCPYCNTTQTISTYESITADISPDLKSKLLNNKLFNHNCKNCGNEFKVVHALLYHDPSKMVAIWFLHEEKPNVELQNALDLFSLNSTKEYKLRIVYSHDELKEKIFIFDSSINDWFVHMLKIKMSDSNLKSDELFFESIENNNTNNPTINIYSAANKGYVCISNIKDPFEISRNWDKIEPELDWIYVSDNNFYKVYQRFGHLI